MQHSETVVDTGPAKAAGCFPETGFTAGKFALVLALMILAAFPMVLAGLETFVIRDFGFFAYPLAQFQRECFWRGELPLWNPFNHCGIPFLAQWNTMPLYPPALIYLVLPLPWSLNFFCLLHLFWGGLGMYFLARRWTDSGLGAAIAGMAFGFNGFALNLLMWPSHIATFSWMPWVVLAVEAGWSQGGRKLVLAALVGAMQMLAGGPETILFTWLLLTVFWIARIFGRPKPGGDEARWGGGCEPCRVAWRFPAMVALVACLAAAQLLPFLDLAAHSQREQGFADARWSMPSWGWANFLVPMVFGTTGKQGLFFQYGQYWTSSYYLGVGVLLLAVLGLRWMRNGRVWLLAGASIVGLVLATGDQTILSRWARQLVPQLSLMTYPVKYVTLVIFAVPLLGAFGVKVLEGMEDGCRRKRTLFAAAGLIGALIATVLIWGWRFPFATDNVPATIWNGLARMVLLVLTALLLWFLVRPRQAHGPSLPPSVTRLAPVLLLLLLWVDVRTHEPQQNPSVPGWVYAEGLARTKLGMKPQPELGSSRAMLTPGAEAKFRELVMNDPKDNFLVKRLGYFANCNLLDGVPTANGFYSLAPRECGELNSLLYASGYPLTSPLADFLSVSQLTSPGDHTAWDERKTFLPFATAGQMPLFLDDTNALGALLSTNFDGSEFVLLSREARGWVTATNRTNARIVSARVESARIDLQVEADAPSLVVLSQTYYHPWRARVNGQPERVLRANFAFQAVQVGAGKHQVTLTYEDRAFRFGMMCSGLGLLICLCGWLAAGRVGWQKAPAAG